MTDANETPSGSPAPQQPPRPPPPSYPHPSECTYWEYIYYRLRYHFFSSVFNATDEPQVTIYILILVFYSQVFLWYVEEFVLDSSSRIKNNPDVYDAEHRSEVFSPTMLQGNLT